MSPLTSPGAPGLKRLEVVLAGFDFGADAGGPGGVAVAESHRAGIEGARIAIQSLIPFSDPRGRMCGPS